MSPSYPDHLLCSACAACAACLLVGLYKDIPTAVHARDAAMVAVYGEEKARSLGALQDDGGSNGSPGGSNGGGGGGSSGGGEPLVVTEADIQAAAVKLANKPQVREVMEQHGQLHLLDGVSE